MTVALTETRLKSSTIEVLARITADETTGAPATATPSVEADW